MVDANLKILIVDDFATMRKILKKLLRRFGYSDIHEADDGVTALAKLKKERFGLIIADWNMPEMSGLDLLKNARADENHKNTPFLMVTAESGKNAIVAAIQSGANDYLIKPFNERALEEKLIRLLGS